MRHQLSRNSRTHGPHRALGPTVRTAHLASDGHVTSNTGHKNDTSALSLVLDHLLSGELGGVIHSHDIHAQKLLMCLERSVEECEVLVDTGGGHADVQLAVKVGFERLEALSEAFYAAYVDSGMIGFSLDFDRRRRCFAYL